MKNSKPSNQQYLSIPSGPPIDSSISLYPRPKEILLHSGSISCDGLSSILNIKKKRKYYQTISLKDETNRERRFIKKFKPSKLINYARTVDIVKCQHGSNGSYIINFIRKIRHANSFSVSLVNNAGSIEEAKKNKIHKIFKSIDGNITKLNISFYFNNENKEEAVFYILWKLTASLQKMSNLAEFSLTNGSYSPHNSIENPSQTRLQQRVAQVQIMKRQISHLTVLKRFTLFNQSYDYLSTILLHNISSLQNLQVLELSLTSDHLKSIITQLKQLQSLSSLYFYKQVDPNDALCIVSSNPNLTKLSIRQAWIFDSLELPILKTLNPADINITELYLNPPLEINSKNDVDFVISFLSPFRKLKSLNLYLQSNMAKSELFLRLDDILKNNPLQELILGVTFDYGARVGEALDQLTCIAGISKLSLVIKLYKRKEWKTIQAVCPAIGRLLKRIVELKELEIYIEQVPQEFLEQMRVLFGTLVGLNFVRFSYSALNKWSKKNNTEIGRDAEKLLEGYNASERLEVILYLPFGPSDLLKEDIGSKVQMGLRVKQFSFTSKHKVEIPFYRECL